MGQPCKIHGDCGTAGFCSRIQEDYYLPDGNNCGDACECEGDFDGDGDVMQSISLISKPIWVDGKCIVRIRRVLAIAVNILSKKIYPHFFKE